MSYNELVEEVIVKREDPSFNWLELQPKVIAVLLETYTLPKHSIHLDNIRSAQRFLLRIKLVLNII